MLFIFDLCLLCFLKKLKEVPWFLKKLEYLVTEIFPIGAFLRCAADKIIIEVLLF